MSGTEKFRNENLGKLLLSYDRALRLRVTQYCHTEIESGSSRRKEKLEIANRESWVSLRIVKRKNERE